MPSAARFVLVVFHIILSFSYCNFFYVTAAREGRSFFVAIINCE